MSVLISLQTWASPIACQDITEILEKRMPIEEALSITAKEKNDVIILSDDHNDKVWTHIESIKLLEGFKKSNPDLDCLFLEHPSNLQKTLEDFEASRAPWEKYVEAASSLFQEATGNTTTVDNDFKNFFAYKQHLVTFARANGIKLFAVDMNLKEQMDPSLSFFMGLLERNKVMASKISHLMEQKICKKGVLFVGDAHALWTPNDQPKQTVSQYLSNSQLKVATLVGRKISDAFRDTPFEFTEPTCQLVSDLPASAFAILSSTIEEPLYKGHLTKPTISDSVSTVGDIQLRPLDQSMIRAWFFY